MIYLIGYIFNVNVSSEELTLESRNQKTLYLLGVVIIITGILAIAADFFSIWSLDPRGMSTAISVDFETIKYTFLDKPRWNYIIGNYLGTFVLPIFHLVGIYLVAIVLKSLGRNKARIFLLSGVYIGTVGAGFHGTLAFVGDIFQSGNEELANAMFEYWQPWAYALLILYTIMSLFLVGVILSRKTPYSRWMVFVSPLGVMILSTLAIAILPLSLIGVKSFLAVTGLNLPFLIFYITTIGVLRKQEDFDLSI